MVNLENFFNLSPDLCCVLGDDYRFLRSNSAWRRLLGWTLEQLQSHSWLEFVHAEDAATSRQAFQNLETINLVNRYRHQNGSYRWLSWSGSRTEEGFIYAIAKDITVERQEVEALKTERFSLYKLLDQLPAFLYLQPKNYGVGFYNQRFREVFGDPAGKQCYEAIAGLDHPCPNCPTFQVFDTDAPQLWEWHNPSTGNIYQIYDYPFTNLDGEPMVVEMGLDITAVKKAEAELRKAHAELEQRVIERTAELTQATEVLRQRDAELTKKNQQLERTLWELRRTQFQLVQTEKISSLGQLVAGVAHEVNNPVSFIGSNLQHAKQYIQELTSLLKLYQQHCPSPPKAIQEVIETSEVEYLLEDLPELLSSMQVGVERIQEIMQSLRNFSRVDAEAKPSDIIAGIESTLLILQHRLKATSDRPAIELIKEYGSLPKVECFPGQLNQVFMNILANAIDALEEHNRGRSYAEIASNPNVITISTKVSDGHAIIRIRDNGLGIPDHIQDKLFDAFFTTKPIGKGTGMGLAISHQIVTETHFGALECSSVVDEGTEFIIQLPLQRPQPAAIAVPCQ